MGAIRFAVAAALLSGLAGCGGGFSTLPTPAANPGTSIAVTREGGGRFLSFVGPKNQHHPPFLGVPSTNYDALRSLLDTSTGEAVTQLYVEDSYMGQDRSWDAAQDATGKPLRFIPISHNQITCTNGCSYAEEFAVNLPDGLLMSSRDGLTLYVTAKSGARMALTIPQAQITNQLAAIRSAKGSLATAATVAPARAPAATPAPAAAR